MKKLFIMGAAFAAAFALTSCDSDSDGNSSSATYNMQAYNLYTPVSGGSAPFTGLSNYQFTLAFPGQTVSISVDGMPLPGGGSGNFTTVDMQTAVSQVKMNDEYREMIAFSSENATASGMSVTSLQGLLTQTAYAPGDQEIPGYKRLIPSQTLHYPVMQYILADEWRVRTFWPDMTFHGSTTTTFPMDGSPYQNDNIAYRIVMGVDTKTYALTGKADLIFYNAKFAPPAPEITVVLKDIDVEFTSAGYTVSGSEIIPYMVEAGALQETPRYKFNSLRMECTGDLTTAIINYQVADVFKGRFQGQSIQKTSN